MKLTRDKFLFFIAITIIIHGTAYMYGAAFYIGKTDRPRGKNCNYINTLFQKRSVYYSDKDQRGRCSLIHFAK